MHIWPPNQRSECVLAQFISEPSTTETKAAASGLHILVYRLATQRTLAKCTYFFVSLIIDVCELSVKRVAFMN